MVIFVFLLWLVLNGRVTLELVIFGVLISAIIAVFLHFLTDYNIKSEIELLKTFPFIILYFLNLIKEIILASLNVIKIILSNKKPDSVLIEFHSGIKSNLLNSILANSITLTPGTYTVFQQEDRFVVHCLMEAYGEGIENSSFVKLLKRIGGKIS
ncbi:Na+/H+ antiporter subunit E [Lachnospiraceae bacterium C1.1]|nr:Na+/H+ antiporter subunit E [Lachnospiraceae bacterium C1.1]